MAFPGVEGQLRVSWMAGRVGNHSTAACAFPVSCPFTLHLARPSQSPATYVCVRMTSNWTSDLETRTWDSRTAGLLDWWTPGLRATVCCGLRIVRHYAQVAPDPRPASGRDYWRMANGEWRLATGDWRRHLCSSNIVSQLKLFATCCVSCFITHEATNVCWRRLTVGCARSSGAKGSG